MTCALGAPRRKRKCLIISNLRTHFFKNSRFKMSFRANFAKKSKKIKIKKMKKLTL